MSSTKKTPGVFIQDENAFPNSVVEVSTSVVAFIGYTQKAEYNGKSCKGKPIRITSISEYETIFGRGFNATFTVTATNSDFTIDGKEIAVKINEGNTAYLYNSLRLFYANGGSVCYILSVDTYGGKDAFIMDVSDFTGSATKQDPFAALVLEQEPSLIAVPDAIALGTKCYELVYTKVLQHCANVHRCFAIFDLERQPKITDTAAAIGLFRKSMDSTFLNYGAAYYPWLNTSIVAEDEVTFENIDVSVDLSLLLPASEEEAIEKVMAYRKEENPSDLQKSNYHLNLLELSPTYTVILKTIQHYLNELPPSGAIAGIYAFTDNTRGVWKAPANVAVQAVESPTVVINSEEQEIMNVDAMEGKSVNAIREFAGQGTMVWGARTLDGNSLDWRYVSARRTMIMLEQSMKLAARAYVFEPNTANVWLTVKSMLNNFLFNIWKQGGLAGATPPEAFVVEAGVGFTMSGDDILNGYFRVSVLLALQRPAEFVEVMFQQKQLSDA